MDFDDHFNVIWIFSLLSQNDTVKHIMMLAVMLVIMFVMTKVILYIYIYPRYNIDLLSYCVVHP